MIRSHDIPFHDIDKANDIPFYDIDKANDIPFHDIDKANRDPFHDIDRFVNSNEVYVEKEKYKFNDYSHDHILTDEQVNEDLSLRKGY